MLVELSLMEQRYQAVLAVIQDGWKVTRVASRLGISRHSVHAWIACCEAGGLAALASVGPARSCPAVRRSAIVLRMGRDDALHLTGVPAP